MMRALVPARALPLASAGRLSAALLPALSWIEAPLRAREVVAL